MRTWSRIAAFALVLLAGTFTFTVVSAVAAPPRQGAAAEYRAAWQAANEPYKRALYATKQGHSQEGLKNLHAFRARWIAFVAAFLTAPPAPFAKDAKWKGDLEQVTLWIDQSERQIRAGKPVEAHDTLEQIRIRWMDMRARRNVPTFGDHLTRFHEPMEVVVLTLQDKTPETLTDRNVSALREISPDLLRLWLPVLDYPATGLTAQAARTRADLCRQTGRILADLDRAIKANDKAAIMRSGSQLRPTYAKLYLQFG